MSPNRTQKEIEGSKSKFLWTMKLFSDDSEVGLLHLVLALSLVVPQHDILSFEGEGLMV